MNSYNSTKHCPSSRQARPRNAQLKSSKGGQIGGAGEEERGKCRDVGATHRPHTQTELGAPCIPELQQSQQREEFRLIAHPLWPTALPEESAHNTAEPNTHGRDLGAKIEGRRVRMVV